MSDAEAPKQSGDPPDVGEGSPSDVTEGSTGPTSRIPTPAAPAGVSVEPATPEQTRAFLIGRSGRDFAVLMCEFIQQPRDPAVVDQVRSAPLSELVTRGDYSGLLAYLLLCAFISNGDGADGWSATLPLGVWARALDTTSGTRTRTQRSVTSAASKILGRLEDRKLISKARTGRERKVTVTLLYPDGSGRDFARKDAGEKFIRYVKLSNEFWNQGWYAKLDLPAVAMFLVALNENPAGFKLPTAKVKQWYGWSADTAERGFAKLVGAGLLEKEQVTMADPLSPIGLTTTNRYRVLPPLAPPSGVAAGL
ncbi:hypothetical protein [Rhodococcus qingshengii]|uniref:hypothetical protein n=1 Tax=Rhodococcus qingshengii TaxID=334542 RepID=UPI00294319F7|nr:hypothetical protein [Rhodococcus qingshengii]WOI90397.1 hypothetical protein R0122_29690 [Rhodococcus qingshengii]